MLLQCGFKEIEVAFPSASQTDFDFVRTLIAEQLIPHDVTIQVLTQSRDDLIDRTFEALLGAPRAIVHLCNATAPMFRDIVFRQDKAATVALAVNGARRIRRHCEAQPDTAWCFEYSPETFCYRIRVRAGICGRWRRCGNRAAADDHQPAGGGGECAQRVCRSD